MTGSDIYTKTILTAIAAFLGALVFQYVLTPRTALAQADQPAIFVEPGIVALRKPDGSAQGQGKIMIDLRSGDVWGFPTSNLAPYPMDPLDSKPAVSTPVYLGRFDLAARTRE